MVVLLAVRAVVRLMVLLIMQLMMLQPSRRLRPTWLLLRTSEEFIFYLVISAVSVIGLGRIPV